MSLNVEQIVQDYADFAYIVSHDLGAPLRHVREFTRLLIDARKDGLSPEEEAYVEFLESSLQKIEGMKRALLMFSRLDTRAEPYRAIPLNDVVSAALQELEDVMHAYRPDIICGVLPTLVVEPKQIQCLFYHLIDNALKFHRGKTDPRRIFLSATERDDTWCFEIRDNGIGIAREYHEEVFRLFKRLEPDAYCGIGAGLTFARKIVRRHGGEIWIDSEGEENGTSVSFSLAKRSGLDKPERFCPAAGL